MNADYSGYTELGLPDKRLVWRSRQQNHLQPLSKPVDDLPFFSTRTCAWDENSMRITTKKPAYRLTAAGVGTL